MRFIQAFIFGRHADHLLEIAKGQQKLIREQREFNDDLLAENARLRAELGRQELKSIRGVRDLVERFHYWVERGTDEDTLRDGLSNALVDLNDHVARLEEHSST